MPNMSDIRARIETLAASGDAPPGLADLLHLICNRLPLPDDAPRALHPMQPIEWDDDGVIRFRPNRIVRHLLDNGGIDLNRIAALDFSDEDRMQFAQLIGYSVGGYAELKCVSDESYAEADAAADVLREAKKEDDHV